MSSNLSSGKSVVGTTGWAVVAAGFNAIAGILVARALVPGDRGVVAIVLTASGITSVAAGLGTSSAFRARLPQGGANLRGYWWLSLRLLILLGMPLLVLAAVASGSWVDGALRDPVMFAMFVVYGVCNFLWFQSNEALAALGCIRRAAGISALGSALVAAVVALVAVAIGIDPAGVVACYTFGLLVQVALTVPVQYGVWRRESSRDYRSLLVTGPKLLGYHFGQDLVYRVDRYLLGVLGDSRGVGFYAVATTPAELARIPISAAAQFTLLDAARGRLSLRDVYMRVLLWTGVVAALVPLGWALAPWAIRLVYGDGYAGAIEPFRLLLAAQALLVPYLIISRAVVGYGAKWLASVTGVVGLALMIGSLVWFVPRYGASGAALAAMCAYGGMSLVSGVVLSRVVRERASLGAVAD